MWKHDQRWLWAFAVHCGDLLSLKHKHTFEKAEVHLTSFLIYCVLLLLLPVAQWEEHRVSSVKIAGSIHTYWSKMYTVNSLWIKAYKCKCMTWMLTRLLTIAMILKSCTNQRHVYVDATLDQSRHADVSAILERSTLMRHLCIYIYEII